MIPLPNGKSQTEKQKYLRSLYPTRLHEVAGEAGDRSGESVPPKTENTDGDRPALSSSVSPLPERATDEQTANRWEILEQFNRLIQELLSGKIGRNTFRPWEIELVVDMENCHLQESARKNILRRWQRAVEQQMEKGETMPMKLSEFLSRRR